MVRSPRCRTSLARSLALLSAASTAALASFAQHAHAASGAWSNPAGGNWELATPGNWTGGIVADGADATADFSTIDITADTTVVLTEARTIGNLTFGDTVPTTTGSWVMNGSLGLTLSTTTGTPQITVNTLGANKNVTLNVGILGTGGFLKSGIGQLVLAGTDNNYTGTTSVNRGTLTFANSGSITNVAAGSVLVNVAGAANYGPGVTNATFLSKISTSSTGALAITATDAATNFDFTTGTLGTLSAMSIGAVLNNTVTYTGTITPGASTYRLGGGGGTLQVNSALTGAGNNLVVGNGTNANGTVILQNSANTYGGTTTIASGATLQVGTGGTVASMSGGLITNDGTFTVSRTGNFSFNNNISGAGTLNQISGSMTSTGTITQGALNLTGQTTKTVLTINGGSVTFNGAANLNSGSSGTSSGFVLTTGTAAFNAGVFVGSGNDNCLLQVTNGTFSASTVNLRRTFNTGTGAAPTSGQTTSGFYFQNGTGTVSGDVVIGSSNAGATARQDGGSLSVAGNIVIGAETATNRWASYDMNGGVLNVAGSGGIVIGSDTTGDHSELAQFLHRAGTTTTSGIQFGSSTSAGLVSGQGIFQLNGGTVYVGIGGMPKFAAAGYTARANLTGGTLGASASYSADPDVVLQGTTTIQAADVNGSPFNITFNGAVTGTGSFTKTGGGTVTLASVSGSSYTGNPIISAGTLVGNTSTIRNAVTNNGALVFDQASNATFSGSISGSGSLTKANAGTLTLASSPSYTGPTSITGGGLKVSGTLNGISLANGTTLAVNSGGITTTTLALGSGGGDAMTLGINDGSGVKTINVTASNGLSTAGTTTVDVGTTGLTVGTYVLVDYSGSIQGSGYGGFSLGSLPPRVNANLANNTGNTSVDLVVNFVDFPRWEGTGASPNAWDINTTINWKTNSGNVATTYLESTTPHDQVLFTDAATGTTNVDVTTTVTPSGVTVNNGTKNYTFQSTGKISGGTFLTKQGTGTLTISNTGGNDYTGDTTISAGSIILGADNVLSDNSAINVNGGTLDINSRTDTTGPVILNSGLITGTGGTISATSYDVRSGTINAILGGGALTKTTGGTVSLAAAAAYAGNTTVAEGTLVLGTVNALPTATNLVIGGITTSGTVELNGNSQTVDRFSSTGLGTSNTIQNSVGGPAAVLKINSITSGSDNFAGNLNGNIALFHDSVRTVTLAGTTNTYSGGTTIDQGGVLVFNGDGSLGAVPGVSTQNIIFNNFGGTLRAGASVGTFSLAATRDIFIDFGTTGNIDTGGNANTMTIPGQISGNGNLGKLGNGTLILTNAANSYSGNTSIVAGNLRITTPTAISPNPITMGTATSSVASLQLDSGVSIANGITTNTTSSDGMIDSVGTGGTATYSGTVTAGLGNQLRLAASGTGATLIFTGNSSLTGPFIPNQGNITLAGSAIVTGNQGLIGRPAGAASLNLVLINTASVTLSQYTDLGNARNVSSVALDLEDSSTFSTIMSMNLLDTTNTTGTSVVTLGGTSTLTSGGFTKSSNGASQTAVINFNGGKLLVGSSTASTYMASLANTTVNVIQNATIDTNSFNASIDHPFVGAGAGGLIKNGVGNLTMNGANTWIGNTSVNQGRLILGNNLTTSANVNVNNDAVVELSPTGTGTHVIKTASINIAPAAKVNVQDNKLIITTPGSTGTWNGTSYTGVSGAVATGRGTGNLWDGATGIITSQTAAVGSNLTSIGVAKASDVRPATATATALWAGQTITGTDTLVMYTYGGDANLDGKINIDDYVKIDSGIASNLTGWANGDFNYDGKINIDDYTTVIDANIGNQSGIFFSSGGLSGAGGISGVTAVPEPVAGGAILMLGVGALTRRRNRRTK